MKLRFFVAFLLVGLVFARADDEFDRFRHSVPFKPYVEKYADGRIKETGRSKYLGEVCGRSWIEYDGPLEAWYASGMKQCEMPYRDGELHGVALNWFPNGKKKYSVSWKHGKKDGGFTVYYESEVVSSRGRFAEGKLVTAEFFAPNGNATTKEKWLQIAPNRAFWD